MIPYNKFAGVYDKMEADRHSINMVKYTLRIMRRFGIEAQDGLDLCCGTGSAIEAFCDQGLTMSGLDRSRQMLKVAAEKLRSSKVQLYRKELPRFEILLRTRTARKQLKRFDLVTCFYDSLNYLLTERELKAAFRSVYRHLRPGGWFVFDMNTPHGLRVIWPSQVFAGAEDDLAWVFRAEYDNMQESVVLQATFFVKSGRLWERFDETHTERGYSDRTIRSLLRDVGFQVKGYYRCFTFDRPKATNGRICAVVQRPL
ncbi:MAG: hypothetical protein DRP45_07355 [Candidatus Zixiibacteriota bacterium]|nr:MAG: hypothetical protein DRP45_07355 [candidate division Zixibacteria bacterium]